MIVIDAVLETHDTVDFAAWPVAEPSNDRVLALSGQMTRAEVGSAMAVIFAYGNIPTEPISDLHHLLDQYLVEAEALVAPGGLRVRDTTTEAEIVPGCCFGLENWREWCAVPHGVDVWLGHEPDTDLHYTAEAVRLRQERHAGPSASAKQELEIRLDGLPALLASVHLQLQSFLRLVHQWASEITREGADRLVAVLDESFDISGPLELG